MRSLLAVVLLVVACSFVCIAAESNDATNVEVMLFEVNIFTNDEGVSLHNYGSSEEILSNYTVKDNRGSITFSDSIVIQPGETLTFIKDSKEDSGFGNRHTTYVNGKGDVTFSSFDLSNDGDYVQLFKNNSIVDTFVYDDSENPEDGKWEGQPFDALKDRFAARKTADGCNSSCWYNYLIGGTNIQFDPSLEFKADVTPFLFPESGGIPVYETLEKAEKSVYLNIYEITSKNTISLLNELLNKGVQVNLLLEANPLDQGGYKPVTDGKLKTLSESGATIMLIGDKKNDRYTYDHAKYCIIDDATVVLTSENWTIDNMNGKTVTDPTKGEGNRGWGAIVESVEYASFMKNVFLNDCNTEYGDVEDFSKLTPGLQPISLTYTSPTSEYHTNSYKTAITPGLSPDNSYDAEMYYIDNAKERIFAENQSLTSSFAHVENESPIKHLAQQASAGIDVRLILGGNVDKSIIDVINATSKVKTTQMNKPYLHNKGIICDDTVILASVNWTFESFNKAREFVAIIHSSEITDFFAESYIGDFDRNYKGSGLDVSFTEIKTHYETPGEYTIRVTVKQSGTFQYTWKLDGTEKTTDVPRSVFNLTKGDHTLTITVTDSDGKTGGDSTSFSVGSGDSPSENSFFDKIKPYLAPIAIVLLAIIAAIFKLSTGGKKKKKGKKGKKR